MNKTKESFKDQSVRLTWSPKSLKIIFGFFSVFFAILSIPLFIVANGAYEQVITYDGLGHSDSNCSIHRNNENKHCNIEFTFEKDIKHPLTVYYQLENFYQNHREYVNSVNFKQLSGKILTGRELESSCGNRTYSVNEQKKVLVPCGYIANSYFNDVFTLITKGVILNEHDISYKGDRNRFDNPDGYDKNSEEYQYIYETYPQIKKEKSESITSSNYYGGGVRDEHFLVWMRLAGLPKFRKIYGRLDRKEYKKGEKLSFSIESNFEVSSFKGKKSLVLATENFIGGKNYAIGITFVVGSVIALLFVIGIIIAESTCPSILPINGGKFD